MVSEAGLPMLGAEDFSYFLQKVPGCFFFFGGNEAALNGWARLGVAGQRSNCVCHNTGFDYNDNVSPLATVFWVRLVEEEEARELEEAKRRRQESYWFAGAFTLSSR